MPQLGSSDNSVQVQIKSTADNSGFKSTESALSKLNSTAKDSQKSTENLTSSVFKGQLAYDAFKKAVRATSSIIGESIQSANRYQGAIIGLSSVSRAFGQDQDAANAAAKQLSNDGLLSVTDSADGLKNLLASGFGLDQAIELMNRFKDSAAFNRQGTLQFGEAIVSATQGIKNGNSILVDNAGITKNLSVILEEAGYSAQDLMKASQDAGVRQALFNGILKESNAFLGDSARLSQTAAGADARLAQQKEYLKQKVGLVANGIRGGLVSALTQAIGNNQNLIVSLGAGAVAATTASIAMFGLGKAMAFMAAGGIPKLLAGLAALNPILIAITAAAAVFVGVFASNLIPRLEEANNSSTELGDTLGSAIPQGAGSAGKAMQDLAKKLKDIDDNILKANRDFQESMADIVKSHQDKVSSLEDQLKDEESKYKDSNNERLKEFERSQTDEKDAHDKKVSDIEEQIQRELRAGYSATSERVLDLKQKLAEEEAEFNKTSDEKQLIFEEESAKIKAEYEKRRSDLQTGLDEEKSFLDKHAEDVKGVRNVMLLDEIDKLKRSHDEQLKSFEKQKQDAIESAKSTAAGVGSVWDGANASLNNQFSGLGSSMGTQMGNAFKQALKDTFKDIGNGIADWANNTMDSLFGWAGDLGGGKKSNLTIKSPGGWADGGFTGRGDKNEVAGLVHRGEYVIPKEFVNQTTGLPMASPVNNSYANNSNQTVNATYNVYNQLDMEAANRDLGWRLAVS